MKSTDLVVNVVGNSVCDDDYNDQGSDDDTDDNGDVCSPSV